MQIFQIPHHIRSYSREFLKSGDAVIRHYQGSVMLNASLLHVVKGGAYEFGHILRTVSSRTKPIVFALINVTLETAVGMHI